MKGHICPGTESIPVNAEASIPLIDLNEQDDHIIPELTRALRDIGFVLVAGHGIPDTLVNELRTQMAEYFDRPLAEKLRDTITRENYRGYIPLGFFSPNNASPHTGSTPDQYEGYKLHLDVNVDDAIRASCDLYGPNRWPDDSDSLQAAAMAFWQACDRTGQRLLSLIAGIMAVDKVDFLSLFEYPLTNMTLLHYPPTASEGNGFGIHPHKDTDALTLLFPDPVGGLWLRPRAAERWLEVSAPPGVMVVNIGDLLELWSGGLFVSTPHKVVNASGQARYSFPYFMVPRHDVVVEPLIPCQPGFHRNPVPVGAVSREVWRTNWPDSAPDGSGFDLGTLAD
jgi:isopenicillin N synthase-like dioxygenase